MNFFAAAPLSRPSRGFIPLMSFLLAATSLRLVSILLPSTILRQFSSSSASRGVSSPLSFLIETSALSSSLHSLSIQVSRISTCSVVRNHRDYHGDRPGGHGSSLSSDSDLRQLKHDRSVMLFVSLEPSIPCYKYSFISDVRSILGNGTDCER